MTRVPPPTGLPHADAPSHVWAQMADHIGAYVYVKDAGGRYLYANAAVCAFYGATPDQVLGACDAQFIDVEQSSRLQANDDAVLATGQAVHDEEEVVLRSGARRGFWTTKVPLRDAQGQVVAVCGFSTDITGGRSTAEHLIGRNQLLGMLLANIDAHIYLKDHRGRYLYANDKVLRLYGRTLDEVLGRDDAQLLGARVAVPLMAVDRQVLDSLTRHSTEEIVQDADGGERHYWSIKLPLERPGEPPCLLGFSSEITELLQLRQNLERQRVTDGLTGLPNYLQFGEELALALRLARRDGQLLAVALFDLDEFKYINTHLGQEAGNQLLREAAQRLRQMLPAGTSLARLGGDAFAVVFAPLASVQDAQERTQALRESLAAPFALRGKPVRVTASAGLALYPQDGDGADALLGAAEAAMFAAKAQGRDRLRRYTPELAAAAALRVDLENDLRAALAAGQFVLHYQPKLRARDGGLAGFEALLRWQRPGSGMVPPLQFIPLAEQLGLLVQIGAWVVEQACQTMAAWRAAGLGRIPVAVNLSPSQLQSPQLLPGVRAAMQAHGIAPGELEMEVTESMMMAEPEQAIAILQGLADAGVVLSIDDFGTGYSSMAYLKLLPVRWLKLDRQFVKEVDTDPRDADLCAGIIALAHQLGLQVVAEGVETAAQRDVLAARGCDVFQGYWFSKPLPLQDAADYARAQG